LTGIELSDAMLRIAMARAAAAGRQADLRLGDATALPFADETFDTVTFCLVLCTIPDDARAVAEAVRVLRPGGRIVAFERDGASVALQAGDLRVVVDRSDLEPITIAEVSAQAPGGAPRSGRRGDFGVQGGGTAREPRDRSTPSSAIATSDGSGAPLVVPSTLDLRGARVEEALEALDRYLGQASLAGAPRVTIIHGHGTGAMRDAVRTMLQSHPLVRDWRPGERGEGGDGASIATF